jgi:hypothetical protein
MAPNGTQINVFLPEPEHAAFKRWCREHEVPLSLTDAIRELVRMAAAGQVQVDRETARRLGGRPPKLTGARRRSAAADTSDPCGPAGGRPGARARRR